MFVKISQTFIHKQTASNVLPTPTISNYLMSELCYSYGETVPCNPIDPL